jgi:hypothetical protein
MLSRLPEVAQVSLGTRKDEVIVIVPTIGSEQLDEVRVLVRAKFFKNRSLFFILLFVVALEKSFDRHWRVLVLYERS